MNVISIIQARMESTRLSGKVILPLGGKPAIQHVIERAKLIPGISKVIVATPMSPTDDPLVQFCNSMDVPVFRGSENDVLDRYYRAALLHQADVVMRITADCPLIDPIESGKVIKKFFEMDADYVSNTNPPMLPDGLDTEAFSIEALKKAWNNAKKKSEREHVTLYIYSNPQEFKIGSVLYQDDLNQYRLTLDEMADYILLKKIFSILEEKNQFGYLHEVVLILKSNPEFLKINRHIQRNEGLLSSLRED